MTKNKELTKRHKVFYNGSIPMKHCGQVIAFSLNGDIYIQCRKCRKWVKIQIENREA